MEDSKEIAKQIVDVLVKAIEDNFNLIHKYRDSNNKSISLEDKIFLDGMTEKILLEKIPGLNK